MNDLVVSEAKEIGFFQKKPAGMVKQATDMANVLKDVIVKQKLSVKIGPNEYVKMDGWATLGAFLGILPREKNVIEHDNGDFEAYVDLIRQNDGVVVGGASSLCSVDEKRWGAADRFARRSMAITRATGKAYRISFAWIMALAGYAGTPFEEMPEDMVANEKAKLPTKTIVVEATEDAGYSPQNRTHQDWLLGQLKKKKVPEANWDKIGNALKGRPAHDLDNVLKEQQL